MLKPSDKKMQNKGIKKMAKSNNGNSWNETNTTSIFFTLSTWALTGNPCFNFTFEMRQLSFRFLEPKKKGFFAVKICPVSLSK